MISQQTEHISPYLYFPKHEEQIIKTSKFEYRAIFENSLSEAEVQLVDELRMNLGESNVNISDPM